MIFVTDLFTIQVYLLINFLNYRKAELTLALSWLHIYRFILFLPSWFFYRSLTYLQCPCPPSYV